jgi:uncharacterized protein YfkK (UPF0435 family)
MDLIQIHNNKGALSPYALSIKEFKDLKVDELAYIYFMVDHRSPYSVYEWEQRIKEVTESIFDKESKWKPTTKVMAACAKYDKLIETSAVRLLKAAKESIMKLERYFRTIDLTLLDDRDKPIYSAKDLISNLEKMGKVVDGLTKLEEIVQREEQAANSNRGGVEVNKYNM